jgi:sigma-B regulation protein RsbU (phosphoserine phosphatase)
MREGQSPGHHIAVRVNGQVLQAAAHGRASAEALRSMETAATSPSRKARHMGEHIVAGSSSQGEMTVYVSEKMTNIENAVRLQVVPRLVGVVLIAIVAALIVNFVFLRMVDRPLRRLVHTVERIGNGELGATSDSFGSREFSVLSNAVNGMSTSLAKADQVRRGEMAKAKRIQQNLLPHQCEIQGTEVASVFRPAADVAGDYYDVFRLRNGTWIVVLADVTGHGVPAAMTAAILKAVIHHATEHCTELSDILGFVNRRLTGVTLAEDFVAMILVQWQPETRQFRYANAGHEPAWLVKSDGSAEALPSTGLLLGIDELASWDERSGDLAAGHQLVLMTDGVTEAANAEGEQFGRNRVGEYLRAWGRCSAEETVERLQSAVDSHLGDKTAVDDVTILGLRFCGADS